VRTLQEQIAGSASTSTGLMNDTCKAGVKYSDVQLDHAPIAYTRDGVTYSSSLSLPCSRRTIAAAHRVPRRASSRGRRPEPAPNAGVPRSTMR